MLLVITIFITAFSGAVKQSNKKNMKNSASNPSPEPKINTMRLSSMNSKSIYISCKCWIPIRLPLYQIKSLNLTTLFEYDF